MGAGDKLWTKNDIINLLDTSDKAVTRALSCIYNKQTDEEKNAEHTHKANKVGFSSFDAEYLSSCAKFAERAGFLTANQLHRVRPKIKKYWRQLLNDMKARGYNVSFK